MLQDAFVEEMEKLAASSALPPKKKKLSRTKRAALAAPAVGGVIGAGLGAAVGRGKGAFRGLLTGSGVGWLAPAALDAKRALQG